MMRITEAWFEFKGIRCTAKNVRLMQMPSRPIPAPKGRFVDVPGRDGLLWIDEGARDATQIKVSCETMDGYSRDAIAGWLQGSGALRFSDEQGRTYDATVAAAVALEPKHLRFDRQILTVTFDCQPFKRIYPAPGAVVIGASGASFTNAGSSPSAPRITATATGDYSLTVGGQLIEVTGGSVIIDSELMDCFETNGVTLANTRVSLTDFPLLAPGSNTVTWTGNVSKVEILPRSRCL